MGQAWRRWLGGVAVLGVLGGCGDAESARERVDTRAVVAEYRRSHADADRARRRLRQRGEPAGDTRTRKAAHACLRDWQAAPEERHGELLSLWEVAVTREAWRREARVAAAWIRRLRAIRGLDQVSSIRYRRDGLEEDHARLSAVYARPIALCEVVREWRRPDWQPPLPDHNGYCDPVFGTLAPDDGFCG